ncbi:MULTISPECIES: type II secretion system secretin GspD [unclassified Undibacterium]|uniref:type II secretion system secretin GspD n=1 Tax=unclassified Undibacterium TaxID=2630295 RepID=UPI002AC8F53B|nr:MULTISPECIES: type II secretion system secretin GspD [unclassified Undibacterium]MEB0138345.1 type II secretion system secretin GspD [Undibacterium sp. CCC2.1]MEB0172722.1 type II secretion system secretin GspD [Undibacterium sp. CCC1.1]MEB0174720.1 type II secretion system secretin GspD [Undibacterium sp. CCC3.4]MEB0213917.1 type II secretion system secretin GspD [Undibacterium sp. 5I2]WPX42641.1 type II secretion system secretin GspD [Undibacterium sp. CCC3.4]
MTTTPLNIKAAMLSNYSRKPRYPLSTMAAAVVLTAGCFIAGAALAQAPGKNSADLNFVGADIESVVKAIGHYTGTTFIIDPRVKGQVNLVSETPLSKEQAFKLLTSTLRLQGYAVVYADGYYKVVPEADAKLQAGPTQAVQSEKTESVKGDQVATQIIRLNYESAANVVTVLRPLISPNNTINANPGNNSIVITDYADNLKRLNKIIAALDVPAVVDLEVIPVKYAMASDIAALVSKLTDSSVTPGDTARAVLMADPRTNSLLLRAPSQARANLIKSLVGKMDQPTALPGNVHVVYLKNAEAVKLAVTLRSIVTGEISNANTSSGLSNSNIGNNSNNSSGGSNQSSGFSNTNNNGGASGGLNNSSSSSQSSSAAGSSSGGSAAGFIQADAATNTLIITASEAVYKNLRMVIDQLDARRAQVYIEALIVEVTADKSNEFGVQWAGVSGDSSSNYRVGGGTLFSTAGNNLGTLGASLASSTASTVLPSNGLSIGVFKQVGGKLGLGALAHLVDSAGGTNILSMPNLLTLDNEEAKIVVGQNVPFVTGQYTTSTSSTSNPFQTIERKDVGLKLTIRPQISEGGTVKLAIYQESSAVLDSSTTSPNGPSTTQRSITTNVLVEDGSILALGGLIQDTVNDAVEKVPVLGDIPFLGNLFKYQTAKRNKTNLMVFLRPTIVRSADQSTDVSVNRYDYMRAQMMPASGGNAGLLPEMKKGELMSPSMTLPQTPSSPAGSK